MKIYILFNGQTSKSSVFRIKDPDENHGEFAVVRPRKIARAAHEYRLSLLRFTKAPSPATFEALLKTCERRDKKQDNASYLAPQLEKVKFLKGVIEDNKALFP